MRRRHSKPVPAGAAPVLVCPSCRQPPDAWPVNTGARIATSFTCTNPACALDHPALPGTTIPLIVSRGRETYEDFDAEVRFDRRTAVEEWIMQLERGSDEWERAIRVGMYTVLHHGTTASIFTGLHQRFIATLTSEVTSIADLGCGVGGFTKLLADGSDCPVIGIDSWALALRVADAAVCADEVYVPVLQDDGELAIEAVQTVNGRSSSEPHSRPNVAPDITWIAADVLDPPLPPASFDLVTAINLFDTVSDPALAIGQASALLRPGGHLLVAQPDALSATTTPPGRWLRSRGPVWDSVLAHYGLVTIDEDDGFDWVLHRDGRISFEYTSHASLLRLRP